MKQNFPSSAIFVTGPCNSFIWPLALAWAAATAAPDMPYDQAPVLFGKEGEQELHGSLSDPSYPQKITMGVLAEYLILLAGFAGLHRATDCLLCHLSQNRCGPVSVAVKDSEASKKFEPNTSLRLLGSRGLGFYIFHSPDSRSCCHPFLGPYFQAARPKQT
jgi:hypothetical protein